MVIVCVAGFIAALVGSMSGGGAGIIQLAALLAVGLPANAAMATHIFGDLGFYPAAVPNFWRAGWIDRHKALPIILINLLATASGTLLIIYLDEELFARSVAISLVVLLWVTRQDDRPLIGGASNKSWPVAYWGSRAAAAAGISNNLLAVFVLIRLRGLTALQAIAHAFVANGVAGVLAVAMLFSSGLVNPALGVPALVANYLGAHIGSRIAVSRGHQFVRRMMVVVTVGVAAHLLVPASWWLPTPE